MGFLENLIVIIFDFTKDKTCLAPIVMKIKNVPIVSGHFLL
jgi:hypothetical protein